MSLAVDASSPTAAIGSGATTVTAAFTPPDNSLLVAFCAGDANNGSLDEDQTVTDSTSTTWTKKVLHNASGGACVTVHYRRLSGTGSSPGSITATLTDNKGSVPKRIFARVFVDAATGIAPDIGATGVSATANVSLTTTVNNSWVWSIALTANAVLTAGTGCTQQDDFGGFDSGDAIQTESQTSLTSTSGTVVTNGLSGTSTVPHNIAVEIIPGSAGGASTTPGPYVVSTTTAPARTQPVLLRTTLQDPAPLATPGPQVVTTSRPPLVPRAILLRSSLLDPPLATPQPYVVTGPAKFAPGGALLGRSSLVDAVVVPSTTTPAPIVVTPTPKAAPVPPVYVLRSTLTDPTPPTPGPTVVTTTTRAPAGQVLLLRSSLLDPSTPGPYVVSTTARAAVNPVLLLRGSLFDATTSSPYVVTTAAVRASIYQPVLLRSTLADPVIPTGVSTPQPYVVTRQPAAARTAALILAAPVGTSCDCTTHRPYTGITSYGSSGITARPNTGITTRPCSC